MINLNKNLDTQMEDVLGYGSLAIRGQLRAGQCNG